jgi:ankyrin repeat protein
MGNSQQAAGAESTGSLLDAVRSFDKNRIEQLSKKPEWKVSLAETDAEGNGPLHIIAKVGHYKYPPAGIPKLLIESGIDINARNYSGVTALEISLLTGWQKVGDNFTTAGGSYRLFI